MVKWKYDEWRFLSRRPMGRLYWLSKGLGRPADCNTCEMVFTKERGSVERWMFGDELPATFRYCEDCTNRRLAIDLASPHRKGEAGRPTKGGA